MSAYCGRLGKTTLSGLQPETPLQLPQGWWGLWAAVQVLFWLKWVKGRWHSFRLLHSPKKQLKHVSASQVCCICTCVLKFLHMLTLWDTWTLLTQTSRRLTWYWENLLFPLAVNYSQQLVLLIWVTPPHMLHIEFCLCSKNAGIWASGLLTLRTSCCLKLKTNWIFRSSGFCQRDILPVCTQLSWKDASGMWRESLCSHILLR